MTIDLVNDIRPKLDELAEEIIISLKRRSRFLLNEPVYRQEFKKTGKTWFEYRLFKDQDTDSEFGRYVFDDQHPMLFSRDELAEPAERKPSENEVVPVDIDMGDKIVAFYREILPQICQVGYNNDTYGETVLQDSLNIRTLYERVCGIGPYVAQSKIQDDPSLLDIVDELELREKLVYPDREEFVMAKGVALAEKYGLPNPEVGRWIFRRIIDLTLDVEVAYINHVQEQTAAEKEDIDVIPVVRISRPDYPQTPPGFGQEPKKESNGSKGWGCT